MAATASTQNDGVTTAKKAFDLQELFDMTRNGTTDERRKALAKMVFETGIEPASLAVKAVVSDKTGAKEVVGTISLVTGRSAAELGLNADSQRKVKGFTKESNIAMQTLWILALTEAGSPVEAGKNLVTEEV